MPSVGMLSNIAVDALAIAGLFLLLIAPHEGGHFFFAKLFKVKVPIFALGMGPKIFSRTWGQTEYSLRALPIGGYVNIAGMSKDDLDDPQGFHSKPGWQRFLILIGGPAANLLTAALLVSGVSMTLVWTDPTQIYSVLEPSPAWSAGLRPGEKIVEVDGQRITSFADLSRIEKAGAGAPLQLVVRRSDGSTFATTVTPQYNSQYGLWVMGVAPQSKLTVGQALETGPRFDWEVTGIILGSMKQLVAAQVPGGPLGPQGLTGPVGIGYITVVAAQQGPPVWIIAVALISVAVGLTNLLPIPALDGARIVVVAVEAVRRKPLPRKGEMLVQQVGLVALLTLMAGLTALDIFRLATGQFAFIH